MLPHPSRLQSLDVFNPLSGLLVSFHNLQPRLTHSMNLDYPFLPFKTRLHIQLAHNQHVGSSAWLPSVQ